jgi:2-polyprenyl-6-methoxyphenol hydroxylase-like FAD-dependent oxidoreductase
MSFDHGIAIIGAGLGGLSLALFLHRSNIKCTIYELRPPSAISTGAILLSPNALRSLDAIGAYSRIQKQGYHFQKITFNTNDHKYMDTYEMGNVEKYGYDAFRIYRQPLLQELRAMVAEAGVEIVYEKKFLHVVSDSDAGVTFAFADGEEKTVDLLIGADGIYSTVRKYLYPDIKPTFSGVMSVFCAIPTAAIKLPFENYPMPVSIHGPGGAFAIVPQLPDESESLGVIQYRTHERTREEWGELERDKEGLLRMMRENYDSWNEIVKSAMDNAWKDTLSIWAYYVVPKLETWKSETAKVVMLGDAAHAIPPAVST